MKTQGKHDSLEPVIDGFDNSHDSNSFPVLRRSAEKEWIVLLNWREARRRSRFRAEVAEYRTQFLARQITPHKRREPRMHTSSGFEYDRRSLSE